MNASKFLRFPKVVNPQKKTPAMCGSRKLAFLLGSPSPGLCGAAFCAPGPGEHNGLQLDSDFVVINHKAPGTKIKI